MNSAYEGTGYRTWNLGICQTRQWPIGFKSLAQKFFLEDISPFVGTLILLFWTSGDVFSGFQSQSGQPYLHLAEAYMIYIP